MKSSLILKKLHLTGREFVSSEEIKFYCSKLNLSYEKVIRYFIRRKYLIRIFKGIFYVKNWEEIKYIRVVCPHCGQNSTYFGVGYEVGSLIMCQNAKCKKKFELGEWE